MATNTPPTTSFSVGDRVEVTWNGKGLAASVVQVYPETNAVDVVYEVDGSVGRYLTAELYGLRHLTSAAVIGAGGGAGNGGAPRSNTSASASANDKSTTASSSVALIVGLSATAAILLLILGVAVWWGCYRRKERDHDYERDRSRAGGRVSGGGGGGGGRENAAELQSRLNGSAAGRATSQSNPTFGMDQQPHPAPEPGGDTAEDDTAVDHADGSSDAAVYVEPSPDQPDVYDNAKSNTAGMAATLSEGLPNEDQTCARGKASGGRKCANKALNGKLYCKMHSCSHAGCDNSKSSKEQASCSIHNEGASENYADLEGHQVPYGSVSGRRRQQKQASVYAGFGDDPSTEV